MKTSCTIAAILALSLAARAASPHFGIHVIDDSTGRGVPLIELKTVNNIALLTDSAGWIAFNEPGLMGREIFFSISGPGYSRQKDGFGYSGIRLTPRPGETATIKIKRDTIAERIARLTGQGIYRDSELLGLPCPQPNMNTGGVLGQDSVQAVIYRGRIFWLWGDTNIPNYPLGNFHTTSATTPIDIDPENGIPFLYYMETNNPTRLRKMMPLPGPGAVWLFGLLVITNNAGHETLLAHYGRYPGLNPCEEHGIAQFNDHLGIFEKIRQLEKPESWRHLRGNAVRVTNADGDFYYFAFPFCHTRVKANLTDITDPAAYEALRFDEAAQKWQWQKTDAPTTQDDETKLLNASKIPPHLARYALKDPATGKNVTLHNGSIHWNTWKKKYIMIALQKGGDSSFLGEVWYAEADDITGPWQRAIKIATHPRYSFYNPVHHPFLDRDGGRIIHFEGTYAETFSGNPLPTPRYDYNQLLYRLDLADPRLQTTR